jgi:PadR family transcriptional regulator, regulatory protein AphA
MNAAMKVPTPSVEYSLLGLLGERPMHGYELHQELCRKTGLGLVWTVKQAQLYAILAKLETEGLIAAEVVAQGNRPPRKVFHLTESGEAAYGTWVRSPAPRRDFRLDFLAKLFFAQREGLLVAEELLAGQRKLCSSWVEEMRARGGSCEESGLDSLVYRYRIGQLEATLAWLDECSDYLRPQAASTVRSLS